MRIAAQTVVSEIAKSRSRVVSSWRLSIVLRRICLDQGEPLVDPAQARRIEERLVKGEVFKAVPGLSGVYVVSTPYADLLPISDELLLQEANPWATFSHLTALVLHGWTEEIPKVIYATQSAAIGSSRLPLGTTPEEWLDLCMPGSRRPKVVGKSTVDWTETKRAIGFEVGYSQGQPVYVTDREQTLMDCLRFPQKSGGILSSLRAWRRARGEIDVDRLVGYVDRDDSPIVRQRIGYLLDVLGLGHPRLAIWKQHLRRGSSMKLVADKPFSPIYSADWNLSLNVPESILDELKE